MYGRVERVEWPTPNLVRLVLGGEGLHGFTVGEFTDHYVKLLFPPSGAPYRAPFDIAATRALPADQRPVARTYTVRHWDADRGELTLDVVVHGDQGIAGPWARDARPGDVVTLRGPGGGYAPDPAAAWHLMVGDESALPAIAASLLRVPAGVPVRVLAEVGGPDDELPLESPGSLVTTWLHRPADDTSPLPRAVRDLPFPPGPVHAFVHGEAGAVRDVRRHLLAERGVPRAALSASGYWRRSLTDEAWRAGKAEWNRAVEADVQTPV